ncbi:MAG: hypothetical protein ACLUD0_07145 [Eubacterium ramulus]
MELLYPDCKDAGDSQISTCVDFVEEFVRSLADKDRQPGACFLYGAVCGCRQYFFLQTVTINNSLSQACWGDLQEQK